MNLHGQFQTFCRRFSDKRTQGSTQKRAQQKGYFVQFHLVCFNFRKVEDVVDNPHQMVGRSTYSIHELPLFFVQWRVSQQVRHADNPVHWRTDFVAHVGQKLALGPIGRLSKLHSFTHLFFSPFPCGDINLDGNQAVDDTLIILYRRDGSLLPENFTGLRAVFEFPHPATAVQDGVPQLTIFFGRVIIGSKKTRIFAHNLISRIAGCSAEVGINIFNITLQRGNDYRIGALFDSRRQRADAAVFILQQQLLLFKDNPVTVLYFLQHFVKTGKQGANLVGRIADHSHSIVFLDRHPLHDV